jgi:hypothetical protein
MVALPTYLPLPEAARKYGLDETPAVLIMNKTSCILIYAEG